MVNGYNNTCIKNHKKMMLKYKITLLCASRSLILGCIASIANMWYNATDSLYICLSVTIINPAKRTKLTRSIWKMLGPFATASRRTPIHQVLLQAAWASMSTMTMTTRDRGDRYGPIEWAQLGCHFRDTCASPLYSTKSMWHESI